MRANLPFSRWTPAEDAALQNFIGGQSTSGWRSNGRWDIAAQYLSAFGAGRTAAACRERARWFKWRSRNEQPTPTQTAPVSHIKRIRGHKNAQIDAIIIAGISPDVAKLGRGAAFVRHPDVVKTVEALRAAGFNITTDAIVQRLRKMPHRRPAATLPLSLVVATASGGVAPSAPGDELVGVIVSPPPLAYVAPLNVVMLTRRMLTRAGSMVRAHCAEYAARGAA